MPDYEPTRRSPLAPLNITVQAQDAHPWDDLCSSDSTGRAAAACAGNAGHAGPHRTWMDADAAPCRCDAVEGAHAVTRVCY